DQEIDHFDRFLQRLARGIDPQIHRVESNQFRIRNLFANAALQIRLDVTEKNQTGILRAFGQLWLKTGKDIQMRVERMRNIQIVFVFPEPAKSFSVGNDFQIARIDLVSIKNRALLSAKVPADDCY